MTPAAISVCIALILPGQSAPPECHDGGRQFVSSRIRHRVVKAFDFDERPLGNYELTPMNWRQDFPPGHPRFLEARFDETEGHERSPSFKLPVAGGGSIQCRYLATDIPVHPQSDYRISTWVRARGLHHSRTCLTAYFLDHALRPIEGSDRRGTLASAGVDGASWQKIEFTLPGGVPRARWIGLAIQIQQVPSDGVDAAYMRPVARRDVSGAAWFDDVTILRLPRVRWGHRDRSGIVAAGDALRFDLTIDDIDPWDLKATIRIEDADGRVVETRQVNDIAETGGVRRIDMASDLSAGQYSAQLLVRSGDIELLRRDRALCKLGRMAVGAARETTGIGISLPPEALRHTDLTVDMLDAAAARIVKIPLWHRSMDDETVVRGDDSMDRLVRAADERGIALVGLLASPPQSLLKRFGHPDHTVVDILSSSADLWRPYLAFVVTRYGQRLAGWQIGGDAPQVVDDPRPVAMAERQFRDVLKPLVGSARVIVPTDGRTEVRPEFFPAEVLSITVPAHFSASNVRSTVEAYKAAGYAHVSATLVGPESGDAPPIVDVARFASRIVSARFAGAESVFVPQPWSYLLALRTLSAALADREPAASVWLDHGATALLFADSRSDDAALVAWRDADQAPLETVIADGAARANCVDIQGHVDRLTMTPDGAALPLGPAPTIFAPVSAWRMKTMASFRLDDPAVAASARRHRRTLRLVNHRPGPLAGDLKLSVPWGWTIEPRLIPLKLDVGEKIELDVALTAPTNQPVVDTQLVGRLIGPGLDAPQLVLRAPFSVDSPGLDVNVLTRLDADRLRVIQRVSNHSGRTLDLRGLVIVPRRPRTTRLFGPLADGETVVREYEIEQAADLAGQAIRVSVEQIDGPLRHHRVIRFE
jgi:hypothetical protein